MVSLYRRLIRFSLSLNFVYLSLILIFGCSASEFQSTNLADVFEIREYGCNAKNIEWQSRIFKLRTRLGSGIDGSVYEITEKGKTREDLVIKVINSKDPKEAYLKGMREVEFSQKFSDHSVKTSMIAVYHTAISETEDIYGAFLLKSKVHGPTLDGLLNFLNKHPMKAQVVFDSFLEFRANLKRSMLNEMINDVYIWDFHGSNIMYDFYKNKWSIVDANLETNLDDFKNHILALAPIDIHRTHPVSAIYDLLWRSSVVKSDPEKFVDKMLDIYLLPYQEFFMEILRESTKNPSKVAL